MTIPRQHLVFGALCVLAPSAMAICGFMHLSHETFAVTCSVIGLFAAAIVFIWSIFSFRQYRLRAVIGIVMCVIVFWLLVIIPGYVEAKRQGLARLPNASLALWVNRAPNDGPTAGVTCNM